MDDIEKIIKKIMNNLDNTAFFIGAGFSKEFGLPLAGELSKLLLDWLTPEKLTALNKKWAIENYGYPADLITETCELLKNLDMNYEKLIGKLQEKVIEIKNNEKRHSYWGFTNYLIELISFLLIERHINYENYFKKSIPYYRGLKFFSERCKPLWIFSLNQDLVIEMICDEIDLILSDGYDENAVEIFPMFNEKAENIGDFTFKKILWSNVSLDNMFFLPKGREGVNLLKIHGSLGEYTYLDQSYLLKIKPNTRDISGWLNSLKNANENLKFFLDGIPMIRSINEIQVTDGTGEMQFLRRTVLASRFKFSKEISQNAPKELLTLLDEKINDFKELIIIGYSFGDKHINEIIEKWVLSEEMRYIHIVDPFLKYLPQNIKIHEEKFTILNYSISDFLDLCSKNELDHEEKMIKNIRAKDYNKSIELFNVKLDEMKENDNQTIISYLKENNYNQEDSLRILQEYKELQDIQYTKFLNKFKSILE